MSSGNFLVTNPKGNNVDLRITFVNGDGLTKKLAIVHPGDTFLVEKKCVKIEEVPRPARLVLEDGVYVKDVKPAGTLRVVK